MSQLRPEVAVIVGVGPGLGSALGRRCVEAGMSVALAARSPAVVTALAQELGPGAQGLTCDATDEGQVERLFAAVERQLGPPRLVIYNAGGFHRQSILSSSKEDFERGWRVGCLGGFLVGRAAARGMAERGEGTILFTGATASIRGSAQFQNFAVGKFGLRALAQSMARELQPRGVHVAHIIIDGAIEGERSRSASQVAAADSQLHPTAIAAAYLQLHKQERSAWTHEIDLRPWTERF